MDWRWDHLSPVRDIEDANRTYERARDVLRSYVEEHGPQAGYRVYVTLTGTTIDLTGFGRTFLDSRGYRTCKRCSVKYGDWATLDKRLQEAKDSVKK